MSPLPPPFQPSLVDSLKGTFKTILRCDKHRVTEIPMRGCEPLEWIPTDARERLECPICAHPAEALEHARRTIRWRSEMAARLEEMKVQKLKETE